MQELKDMNNTFKLNKKKIMILGIILLFSILLGNCYFIKKRSEINNIKYKELIDKSEVSFMDNDNVPEALNYLNEAISILPNNSKAYYLKSQMLVSEKKNEDALSAVNTAIKLTSRPTSMDYYSRGQIFSSLGLMEDALKDYQEAIKKDPNNIDIYKDESDVLILLKRYDEAINVINIVLEKDNKDVDANIQKGFALFSLKKCVEATTYFNRALLQDPNNEALLGALPGILNSKDCIDNIVSDLTYNQVINSKIEPEKSPELYNSKSDGSVVEWKAKISSYYSQITGIKFCVIDNDHQNVNIDKPCDWLWAFNRVLMDADNTDVNPGWDGLWVNYILNYYKVPFDKDKRFYDDEIYTIKGVVDSIDCGVDDKCIPNIDIISITK